MTTAFYGPQDCNLTERQERKLVVFHIIYGWHADANPREVEGWRLMAAEFVSGLRDDVPLTLGDYRALKRQEAQYTDPGPACHGRAYDDACPGCVAYWND